VEQPRVASHQPKIKIPPLYFKALKHQPLSENSAVFLFKIHQLVLF